MDMRLSKDVTGSGIGSELFCFKCGARGHFAHDCRDQTKLEKETRSADPLAQLALAARRQKLPAASSPVLKSPQQDSFVDRNRTDGRQCEQRPPDGKQLKNHENGRWRKLDLRPKNGFNGKTRGSRCRISVTNHFSTRVETGSGTMSAKATRRSYRPVPDA
jgi:hypothetical protein